MEKDLKDLGGLVNKDVGFSKLKSEFLYDSQNFRITANEDGTFAVRTNILGNVETLTIPDTPGQWNLEIDLEGITTDLPANQLTGGIDYTMQFQLSTPDVGPVTITWNYTYSTIDQFYIDLADFLTGEIATNFPPLYLGSVIINPSATVSADNRYVVISGNFSSVLVTSFTDGTTVYTSYVDISNPKPPQRDLKIIGWTTIRDNIFLLTTNGSFDPDDPATAPFVSFTQWWKLSYDKAGAYADPAIYNLTLIYNDQLNCTVYRPVANPGMIEARYESPAIQPIYWTDAYNVPRRINTADPDLISVEPERLNLIPSLEMEIPKIKEVVQGGNLKVGVYQFAYRLKNINGAETKFSRPSKLVPIIDAGETGPYIEYFPQLGGAITTTPAAGTNIGGDANKSIRIRIENVDTSFEIIEFVSIYYKDGTSTPEFNIIREDLIPSSGIYEAVIDSSDNDVPLSIEEVAGFNTAIIRAKTLATKAQTLFLGNITTTDQSFDFDARAYRFPKNSTTTTITQSTGDIYTIDDNFQVTAINGNPVTTPFDIPENYDCIQDYDSQKYDSALNNLYVPGTTLLGGKGPNVEYTFITEDLLIDETLFIAGVPQTRQTPPYKATSRSTFFTFNNTGTLVENISTYKDYNSPYVYDALIGYRRDEMERFGIVFIDEYDNPTYVQWIADIRFPHMFMPDPTIGTPTQFDRAIYKSGNYSYVHPTDSILDVNTGNGDSFDSRTAVFTETGGGLNAKVLGVRFTIDFSSVPDKYKKALIVRVPKTEEDKHIIGQGLVRPTYKTASGQEHIFTSSNSLQGIDTDLIATATNQTWPWYFTLTSPEFNFKVLRNSTFQQGDKLDIIAPLRNENASYNSPGLRTFVKNINGTTLNGVTAIAGGSSPDEFYAVISKNYFIEEESGIPNTIVNPDSENPYNIVFTDLLDNPLDIGGAITHDQGRYYMGQSASDGAVLAKAIYNTSRKDFTGGGWSDSAPLNSATGHSHGNRTLFVQIDASYLNWNIVTFSGHNFLLADQMDYSRGDGAGNNSNYDGLNAYIGNYTRVVANQYGGNTYSQRSLNKYISTGCYFDLDVKEKKTQKVFGGDTFITVVDTALQFNDQLLSLGFGTSLRLFMWVCLFPCETSVNVNLRRNSLNFNASIPDARVPNRSVFFGNYDESANAWGAVRKIDQSEFFNVDPVFNLNDKRFVEYFAKPYLIDPTVKYDCRVWRSERKIDGELFEAWSIFRPNSFLDVESKYGPIQNLIIFQDNLYYFQDRGFGVLQIDQQKLITDASGGADLVIGSTGVLERYDYISTQTGTKHQFSMNVSDYSMVWFDTLARKLYRYNPKALQPISDLKGYHADIYNRTGGLIQVSDNPYLNKGIHCTYDYRFNEFFITILSEDNPITIVYNDLYDGFVGSYGFTPIVYINDKSNVFSVPYMDIRDPDKVFIHNQGSYGTFYNNPPVPSRLTFVVNPAPTEEKVLTNLEFIFEAFKSAGFELPDFYDFFDEIRVYNNYQNTNYQSLSTFSRKHKTVWNVTIPSDRVISVAGSIFEPTNLLTTRPALPRRLKDKWFVVDMIYNNTTGNKIVVHSVKSLYSLNSR